MKRIKCNECLEIWYVNDDAIDRITYCPFCVKKIRVKAEISKPDTLSKAIYKVISEQGLVVLESTGKIANFLSDTAPWLKREIRIFRNMFAASYLKLYRDAFDMELGEAEAAMNRLRQLLVEEEGLSEKWADLLCENCAMSIRYYKGNGLPEVITAEITDVPDKISEKEKVNYESYIEVTKYSTHVSVTKYISGDASFDIPVEIDGLPVAAIEDNAFKGCKNLTKVTIPDGVTQIGESAFAWCENLTSIIVPKSVTKIGDSAFRNCKSLKSVTIPEGVTQIGEWTFCRCESLTSTIIPNSVTQIGDSAFRNCKSLKSITIPDSVTQIGEWAFCRCESLTSIIIPKSVTQIGEWAFRDCKNLKSVTITKRIELSILVFLGCDNIRIIYQ